MQLILFGLVFAYILYKTPVTDKQKAESKAFMRKLIPFLIPVYLLAGMMVLQVLYLMFKTLLTIS